MRVHAVETLPPRAAATLPATAPSRRQPCGR